MMTMTKIGAAAIAAAKFAGSRRSTKRLSSMTSSPPFPPFRFAIVAEKSAFPATLTAKVYFSCQYSAVDRSSVSSSSLRGLLPNSTSSGSFQSLDHRASFHSSTAVEFPVRRRKRAGGSGLGSNNKTNTTSGINGGGVGANKSSPHQSQPQEQEVRQSEETTNGENTSTTVASAPIQHPPIQDTQIFRHAASALLDKLQTALHPMKSKNEVFVISREDGDIGEIFKLDLGPSVGHYLIEISEDECLMQYSSPISGRILYFLSGSTNEWIAVDDGHSFEGIFVRDLIRQCQGLPNL